MQDFRKVVVLTGAGVSAESGLGTFRDRGGVWTRYDLNEVATPEGFARDPGRVHEFYNARRRNAAGAKPNAAHRALARLQAELPGRVTIVTQNVDALHEAAGAEVLHMHGRLDRARCTDCGATWPAPDEMHADDGCEVCRVGAARPDVVWFGEVPQGLDEIARRIEDCDLFAAIGTSGQVWPAAGFVHQAKSAGAVTTEINLEPSAVSDAFDRSIFGPATETVPRWVDTILNANAPHMAGR